MKLNPPNAHRSQIKIGEKRQTPNVQFRFMPNAFQILKPIQKSSKRVWVVRNTGANVVAKNQMRLAYEDKRDLYCMDNAIIQTILIRKSSPETENLLLLYTMNELNHELSEGSEIRCSGKSEHFLPDMWHPSSNNTFFLLESMHISQAVL